VRATSEPTTSGRPLSVRTTSGRTPLVRTTSGRTTSGRTPSVRATPGRDTSSIGAAYRVHNDRSREHNLRGYRALCDHDVCTFRLEYSCTVLVSPVIILTREAVTAGTRRTMQCPKCQTWRSRKDCKQSQWDAYTFEVNEFNCCRICNLDGFVATTIYEQKKVTAEIRTLRDIYNKVMDLGGYRS
jgi:hypothetical protein